MPDVDRTIPLNRSELMYMASEGIVGSIGQVYSLRFREAHTQAELRAAVRHLVRIYPRTRSMITPTFFTHRLRLLPDDARVNAFFAEAFQVVHGVGTDYASLQKYMEEVASEPFTLDHALPIRARLLVDSPLPVLVLIVHHVVCDGRGMVQMMDSLMAYLNGVEHPEVPIDEPSMVPAILPKSLRERVRSLVRSYRIHRGETRTSKQWLTIELGKPDSTFGPPGVCIHPVPFDIPAIKRGAAKHGCSVTELLMALFTASFAREVEQDGRNAVSIRLSVDLRPYFEDDRRPTYGNYVASFMMHLTRWDEIGVIVTDIREQLRKNLERFERKEMSYPLVMGEIASRIGRKIFRWTALAMKRRGLLPKATFHYSTLGSIDILNSHGARAQLDEVTGFVPTLVPFITSWWIGDTLCLTCSYPRHEIDGAAVDRMFADFDAALGYALQMDTPRAQT